MRKPKAPKIRKQQVAKLTKKIIPQLLIQSTAVTVTALCSFFLMTWIVGDVFGVNHIYIAAGYELLGTLVFMILMLVPLNTVIYRNRAREVITLSDAIQRVARGDYSSRISTQKKTQITPIYEDFNKMCDELESVQILRNDFINNYSHEFKTPIASINGFAELLLEKDLLPEERRQYLKIISDESARLSRLAANTTLLSRLSTQHIVTDLENYDLGEQLRECSIMMSGKWMEKNIDFEASFASVMYRGNKEMMQHLWLNLLDNAVKYTPEGGKIGVEITESSGMITVHVRDNGEGMSEEVQRYLFNPYFQGDSSHSSKGLGLGLSIAERIVELCGGEISVKSKPAQGSTFTVKLPVN